MKLLAAWLLGVLTWAAGLHGQEEALGPDSLVHPGVPRGSLTWHLLAPGNFYPGTPHRYAVYLPAGIDPAKPACYMIFLDGSGAVKGLHVPVVLDNLIAQGAVPPLVGIFVDPGVLPALAEAAQNRYERIFEYDSLSPRFSRFLLQELVPEVAKGQPLSTSPDDHGIAGVSTGAVGAFVAAWQRPDQFHRVLSLIGTYVDMKGADELPSLVRKTEPRPMRIFMQDGRNDHIVPGQPWGIFFAGSWPINNQVMYEALKFAGYDVKFVLGEGTHNTKQGAALLPEALRWLWAGYPRPIEVREPATMGQPGYDPRGRVYSLVAADRPWERVGERYDSIGGIAAAPTGEVYFSDPAANRLYRVNAQGAVAIFRENAGGAVALQCGANGRLLAAEPGRRRIVSFGPAGGEEVEGSGVEIGARGLALTVGGDLYFLDRSGGIDWLPPRGQAALRLNRAILPSPAGLALSPDQAMLVVADGHSRYSWSFQLGPHHGLVNGEPFYRLYAPESAEESGVAAVAFDVEGRGYFAGPLGIQVTEQNGRVAAILNGPGFQGVSTLAFGGAGQNWLYAASGHELYRRRMKIAGAASWAPVKPPQPAL